MEETTDISLVWKKVANGDHRLVFPIDVLSELKEKFSVEVHYRSKIRPVAVASMPKNLFHQANLFLENKYPNRVELAYFC